jgi:hypothetical protein
MPPISTEMPMGLVPSITYICNAKLLAFFYISGVIISRSAAEFIYKVYK